MSAYIKTQNLDVNMEAQIIAVYYGMSVDRSLKILHYVVSCRCPHSTVA